MSNIFDTDKTFATIIEMMMISLFKDRYQRMGWDFYCSTKIIGFKDRQQVIMAV